MLRSITLVLGLAIGLAVQAHTPLKSSAPAADASVAPPKTIELSFGDEVRLTAVALTDAGGVAKHLDDVPSAVGTEFTLAVHEPLAPGAYKVVWRAVGGDTHIVSGEFAFTVTAPPTR
jgi:methionine-rich copper-binding protein CopC